MFEAGKQFGRYQIRSQLGAGGMGEIYLAEAVPEIKIAREFEPLNLSC